MTRRRGISKWLNRLKGFGFIEPDEGSAEVFIHYGNGNRRGYSNIGMNAVSNNDIKRSYRDLDNR